ncbi:MAG TPA: hydrogenase maturation protease [Acidimicrobiales bacterium]
MTSIHAPSDESDRFAAAIAVADAALPDGCRGEQGVLVPPSVAEVHPGERSTLRAECVVVPGLLDRPLVLTVRVRCVHLRRRSVEALDDAPGTDHAAQLDRLDSLDQPLIPWDEAVGQEIEVTPLALALTGTTSKVVPFRFSSSDEPEIVRSPQGEAVARRTGRRESVDGRVVVRSVPVPATGAPVGPLRVTVTVENLTAWSPTDASTAPRRAMLRRSLLGVHTLLAVDGGRFASLLDPPPALVAAVADCRNEGAHPVLVGEDDDVVLAAPLPLGDHPDPAGRFFPPRVPAPVAGLDGPATGSTGDDRGRGQAPAGEAGALGDGTGGALGSLDDDAGDDAILPVQAMADLPWLVPPDPAPEGPILPSGAGAVAPGPVAAGPGHPERRVLVAGIGHHRRGDDAFGPVVAQRLAARELPAGVRAVDYGVRGVQLAHDLTAGYDALILVDAMALGEPPGTLAVVEPGDVAPVGPVDAPLVLDTRAMSPGVVLALLDRFEAQVQRIVIIGCQPALLDGPALSAPVAEAVDLAVDLLEDVLTDVCTPTDAHT